MNKTSKSFKAVIFDVGDVLLTKTVDIERQIADYIDVDIEKYKQAEDFVIQNDVGAKKGWNDIKTLESEIAYMNYFYSRVFNKLNIDYSTELVQFATMCRVKRTHREVSGAEKILKALYPNYRLAVLSNCLVSRKYFELKEFGFDKYFELVLISREAGFDKPDKKFFQLALNKLNLTAEECVFVDNKMMNIDTANEMGFGRSVLFDKKNEYPNYSYRITKISQLVEVIELFS